MLVSLLARLRAGALTDGPSTAAFNVGPVPATATSAVSALTTTINATNSLNSKVSANDQVTIYVHATGNNYCVSVKHSPGGKAWGLTAAGGLTSGVNGCTSATAIS